MDKKLNREAGKSAPPVMKIVFAICLCFILGKDKKIRRCSQFK